ncbi:MAG TPA: hypothetical protein VNF68_11615 [Candidatus Baltobacteraceae bacterium]|nr:hypothetical protein [Candidatus Baltobacteraceae bacterium]
MDDTPFMKEVARCQQLIRSAPLRKSTKLAKTMTRDGEFAVLCDLVVFRESEERALVGIAIDAQTPKRLTPESAPTSEAAIRAAIHLCTARSLYGDAELIMAYSQVTGDYGSDS